MDTPNLHRRPTSRNVAGPVTKATRKLDPLTAAVRDLVRAELATVRPDWEWIVWSAWARSQTHARRLAARESIRTTRIGRDLYGHRDDLDALALRNAANATVDEHLEADPEIASLFGAA